MFHSRSYNTDEICTSSVTKMAKLTWTTVMERVLLQAMVDQVSCGKRAESGFKKEALVAAVDQLKEVTTTPDLITLRKAKDKLDTLKAKWNM